MSTAVARRAQSTGARRFSGSSWPVTTAKDYDTVRCVSGMPAYAGTATAELTPGTTSNGTAASTSTSAYSPPRPKTNGSPPFRRTTSRQWRAWWISTALIAPCGIT